MILGQILLKYRGTEENVQIPENVTVIGDEAFSYCSIISITIPDSVEEIGCGAFLGCSSLLSITIPDSVKEIGDYAFALCNSLKSIEFPEALQVGMIFGDSDEELMHPNHVQCHVLNFTENALKKYLPFLWKQDDPDQVAE